jgi:hypothetical protein
LDPLPRFHRETFKQTRALRVRVRCHRITLAASIFLLALFTLACSANKSGNANSGGANSNDNRNANAQPLPTTKRSAAVEIKEPERFSVAMSFSAQGMSSEAPAPMVTHQFGFAKFDADRRWTFAFPAPLGQMVYLEKSGLKYLILSDRKLYVELNPEALGFQLASVLTPGAVASLLKPGAHYEQVGLEPINARTGVKYRITPASDDSTQTDGLIFMDQETSLPLRLELNVTPSAQAKLRVIVEARDIRLNPEREQFEVPTGMKRVMPQEAKQQIDGFASTLNTFVDIIRGSKPTSAAASVSQATANQNAGRRGR